MSVLITIRTNTALWTLCIHLSSTTRFGRLILPDDDGNRVTRTETRILRRRFPTPSYALTYIIVKVKCTLVQALRLCTGRTAQSGSRGIALLFLDHGNRREWGISITSRPLFTPWKDPVPILQETGWTPEPVWTGAENLAPIGIRSPDWSSP